MSVKEMNEIPQSASLALVLYTYIRALFGLVFAIPWTLLSSAAVLTAGILGRQRLATELMRGWGQALLYVFGICVDISGENLLPEEGGGIIVFNHQSHFDIPILMFATRKSIRFGAKIELFKIPVFGAAMRAVGTLPIARENRAEALRVYKEAEARFRENTIFVLAPEGTRQEEPRLGRFKKGPFHFAVNAGVPICPAVIKGAHSVLPKASVLVNIGRRRRTVYVEFLHQIPTKGTDLATVPELTERVKQQMSVVYDRLPTEA